MTHEQQLCLLEATGQLKGLLIGLGYKDAYMPGVRDGIKEVIEKLEQVAEPTVSEHSGGQTP